MSRSCLFFRSLVIALSAISLTCGLSAAAQTAYDPQIPSSGRSGSLVDPSSQRSADTKKYTLSGTVVNSQTGEGVPRALVELNNQLVTMTDANGAFSFDGLSQGGYYVSSRKPGYFDRRETSPSARFMTTTTVPTYSSITLQLVPEAVISGRIADSDGLPVQRLQVQCLRSIIMEGRRQWQPASNSATDEDGEYRISGLMPGIYLVVAGPSQVPSLGAMTKTGKQDAGYSAAYFPGPDDNGSNAGVHIAAGQKLTVDLSVDAEPFYTVTGVINAPPGLSVFVRLLPRDSTRPEHGGMMMRGDNNTFTLRMLPKGDYTLQAGAQMNNKTWASYQPLHVASDIAGLQVAIEPAISIPVNVTVQKTQASQVSSDSEGPVVMFRGGRRRSMQARIFLRSLTQDQPQFMAMPHPDDDTIAIENVAPGTYHATFNPFGNLYVASARCGTTDLLRDNLVVSQSAAQEPIEIVLRDDGGKLKVTVTSDGQPVAPSQGSMLILPEHGAPFTPSQQIYSEGVLTFQNLAPGSYSILAFDSLNDLEYSNPDALDPYMSHAAHFDITPNQEATVSLELIKRDSE